MATIDLKPHNDAPGVWRLLWVEQKEFIGSIQQDSSGQCWIRPEGSHWSPMKSFARPYDSLPEALREVQLYFERR